MSKHLHPTETPPEPASDQLQAQRPRMKNQPDMTGSFLPALCIGLGIVCVATAVVLPFLILFGGILPIIHCLWSIPLMIAAGALFAVGMVLRTALTSRGDYDVR